MQNDSQKHDAVCRVMVQQIRATGARDLTGDVVSTGMLDLLERINEHGALTFDSQPNQYRDLDAGRRLVADVDMFDEVWHGINRRQDLPPGSSNEDFLTEVYGRYEKAMADMGRSPVYLEGLSTTCQRGYLLMFLPVRLLRKFAEVFNTSFPDSSCVCFMNQSKVPVTMSTQAAFSAFKSKDRGAFLAAVESMGGGTGHASFVSRSIMDDDDEQRAFTYEHAFAYFSQEGRPSPIEGLELPSVSFYEEVQCVDLRCTNDPLALFKQVLRTLEILKVHDAGRRRR